MGQAGQIKNNKQDDRPNIINLKDSNYANNIGTNYNGHDDYRISTKCASRAHESLTTIIRKQFFNSASDSGLK